MAWKWCGCYSASVLFHRLFASLLQKEVEDGKVDPIMLHEGETAKEGAEMLEMGTEDHRDDPKAAVPMPDAAEQIADAMEPAAAEGQENP